MTIEPTLLLLLHNLIVGATVMLKNTQHLQAGNVRGGGPPWDLAYWNFGDDF